MSRSKFCSCILCEAKVEENGVVGSKCGLKQKIRNAVVQVLIKNKDNKKNSDNFCDIDLLT